MIGKAVYGRLSSDAGVSALVGNRIYPNTSPENVYPMIVYDCQQEPEDSLEPMVLKEHTVTLTIVTTSYDQAQAIAAATLISLDRQGGTWGGIFVKGFFVQQTSEDSFSDGSNPNQIYYTIDQPYRVWAQT
jgi:hypothetical protein